MAENDIYNSKRKYERFKAGLKDHTKPIDSKKKRRKYYCKNPSNLKYYTQLLMKLEAQGVSFVRRLKLISVLNVITYVVEKDLKKCEREDIDKLMQFAHSTYKTKQSKEDFVKDVKRLWRLLFPEKDEKGRIDERICPYIVRHLSRKVSKSLEKRKDLLTYEEYEKLVNYFARDVRMQAYLTLAFESLGRPQEILYTKIKDVELYDNYAKIWISSHGKEGTKFLQSIDSYPYVTKWLNIHPYKKDKNSFFFVKLRDNGKRQLTPNAVNMMLKRSCKKLGIGKIITPYSLKRAGVSFRRLRGDSDVEIQHAAGWTSTRQLKTYDLSQAEDTFKIELIKRGLVEADENYKAFRPKFKDCLFCNKRVGFAEDICPNCKRPLDREKLKEQLNGDSVLAVDKFMKFPQIQGLFKSVHNLQKEIAELKNSL